MRVTTGVAGALEAALISSNPLVTKFSDGVLAQSYATVKGDTRVRPWRRHRVRHWDWAKFALSCRLSLDGQRGGLFVWAPVLIGIGIGVYFALPVEPSPRVYAITVACALILLTLARLTRGDRAAIGLALCLCLAGFLAIGLRGHLRTAPVIPFRYYGPVEGRVVMIDRSASGAERLILDHVVLRDMSPDRVPARVRISLHGPKTFHIEPGQRLGLTAHVSPPSGPAEPRGFDFQRMAWFDRLGGVGYSRAPVMRVAQTDRGASVALHRMRQSLAHRIRRQMSGQEGAFAAAILTGDRSAISPQTDEALRGSNLSHLLAISGLHMGLLTGAVFGAIRLILMALLREHRAVPAKKVAALFALMAGAVYLALSGWNVATERAFIMVSAMFVAVLLDRRALSMRAVALAATIILFLRPEVLTEPGFQMSFAATTSLVFAFSAIRGVAWFARMPKPLRIVAAVALSSVVAGLATAPVAAAHFNRIADYGLIANLISVPLMGLVIMPMAVLALALAPLGLEAVAFAIMSPAIAWILGVASTVSAWEGAVSHVPTPPDAVLPLMAIGGLFVMLWRGRARVIGVAPLCAACVLWLSAPRPDLLISEDGGLVGIMSTQGRVLSKPKGAGFAARTWLENDGDGADQIEAAARPSAPLRIGSLSVAHVTGRGWQERVEAACETHDIVIVSKKVQKTPNSACEMFDLSELEQTGAVAFYLREGNVVMQTTRDEVGLRLWNTPKRRTQSSTKKAAPNGAASEAVMVANAPVQ